MGNVTVVKQDCLEKNGAVVKLKRFSLEIWILWTLNWEDSDSEFEFCFFKQNSSGLPGPGVHT